MTESSKDYDTGISDEVFTLKSETRLIDIFNKIIDKKATEVLKLFNQLYADDIIDKDDSITIIGTYLTGIGIAKYLSNEDFKNITIIDIYPHLKGLIDLEIALPNNPKSDINGKIDFSSDLELIENSDIIIDTTGLGGLNEEQSSKINCKVFLIEDPIAEDNDVLLRDKNNILKRLECVNSNHKYILKTEGLNTKTSGTMTFTIEILRKSMTDILNCEGVLYCASLMNFFEEIIFKEKDLNKFIKEIQLPALKVSTINPFDCDTIINDNLNKINSNIISKNG